MILLFFLPFFLPYKLKVVLLLFSLAFFLYLFFKPKKNYRHVRNIEKSKKILFKMNEFEGEFDILSRLKRMRFGNQRD